MSQFSYEEYQRAIEAARSHNSNSKVGWFKLAEDQDEALVRFNLSGVNDIQFATVHAINSSSSWIKVSCLNELGSFEDKCPLCREFNNGNKVIGKAAKRVFVQMNVSYKDRASGQWTASQSVIWERPAGFSKELASKLNSFGDLRKILFRVVRNGAKNSTSTTYAIDYAMPEIFKPELVSNDFAAFDNFRYDKHAFWVKSEDEINTFLATGTFPTPVNSTAKPATSASNSYNSNDQVPWDVPSSAPQTNVVENNVASQPQTPPIIENVSSATNFTQPHIQTNTQSAEVSTPQRRFAF